MEQNYIVFDFDNTVVNSVGYWLKAINKDTFKHFGVKPDKYFEKNHKAKGNIELAEFFLECTKLNISTADVLKTWYDYMFIYYTKKVKFIKGVKEYLASLKAQGKTLVLASASGDAILYPVIRELKLDSVFDIICTENEIGYSKRDPMFFAKLLKKLNTTADDVFLFEDSFYSIYSANSVRILSCAILSKENKKIKKRLQETSLLVIKNYKDKRLASL